MARYRFSSLGSDGHVAKSHIYDLECDDDAREVASALLAENTFEAIEVWDVFRLVFREVKARAA